MKVSKREATHREDGTIEYYVVETTPGATIVGFGAGDLESLTDVQISGITNGQVLSWNSSLGKWVNTTGGGGGSGTLAGDTDVTITTPATNDFLVYNGATGKWENHVPSTARTNLGLGTAATHPVGDFAQTANNLSDLANAGTARTNLGLGTAATHATTDFAQTANNLSDIVPATGRTNLGLGSAAVKAADTDGTLAANSDANVPTQKAVKTYVDSLMTPLINKFKSLDDAVAGQSALSAATVKTVDLDTSAFTAVYEVEIINKSGADKIQYTIGTAGSPPPDPDGTNCGELPGAGIPSAITVPNNVVGTIRVKLLSPSTGVTWAVNAKGI